MPLLHHRRLPPLLFQPLVDGLGVKMAETGHQVSNTHVKLGEVARKLGQIDGGGGQKERQGG
ncbi:MAG TPA: hypothetical protein VHS06_08580 [Chloroflexota bacterium]|nr:hypothetical protein [Chloroflexota bacterium]